jgi:hypothetical protein
MKTNNNKQVAAFDQVLGLCNNLGQKYNPGNDSINLAALNSLLASARGSVNAAHTTKMMLTDAINHRQEVFEPLPKIATRILNMLIASEASPQQIEDVRTYRNKLRPLSKPRRVAAENAETPVAASKLVDDRSRGPLSYMDYESKLTSFRSIVDLVAMVPKYTPNEADFTVSALQVLVATLESANRAVNNARLVYGNARSASNAALYGDQGLAGVSKRVKKYILFACGSQSDEFRSARSITLKTK